MSEAENKAIEFFKKQSSHWKKYMCKNEEKTIEDIVLNLIENQQKEIKELNQRNKNDNEIITQMSSILQKLRDELIGDRMEQFDDYIIYLQTKYLKLLGEKEDEK